jgi:competence/damage-inducible protein CinA-like protein
LSRSFFYQLIAFSLVMTLLERGFFMPNAEIITIGTELLLGEILDTNAQAIARALREVGVDLYRMVTVGDNVERIAEAVQGSLERAAIVITTGGLGPTVDDPTRQAVAKALQRELAFHPELWIQIEERFAEYGKEPDENNRQQAYLPARARAIPNPRGTAPAFIVELEDQVLISLPGVPPEMEYLLKENVIPYLRAYYQLEERITIKVISTQGLGESRVDTLLSDLEKLENPTVGLLSKKGGVDIRLAVKAKEDSKARKEIQKLEDEIRERLGKWIVEDE